MHGLFLFLPYLFLDEDLSVTIISFLTSIFLHFNFGCFLIATLLGHYQQGNSNYLKQQSSLTEIQTHIFFLSQRNLVFHTSCLNHFVIKSMLVVIIMIQIGCNWKKEIKIKMKNTSYKINNYACFIRHFKCLW